jgi:hypothetical protein
MLEFMPHREEADGDTPMTSPTVANEKATQKGNLDFSKDSLEFLLEELKKMPFRRSKGTSEITRESTRGTTPHPTNPGSSRRATLNKYPDEKSSYQVTLKHYEDVLNHLFSAFKSDYKKRYESKHEHERRKDIYRHNMR